MKKNTNARKISLIKNNIWKKQLRRQVKIKMGIHSNVIDAQEYQEEIDLLFPLRNSESKEIHVAMEDKNKKILKITVDQGLYQQDILSELDKYKDTPMKGFRQASKKKNKLESSAKIQKKLGSLTLMDFRYGSQIRDSILNTKYFMEAKNKSVELYPQFQELLSAPFNVNTKDCSFNIIFYDNKNNVDNTVQEFMVNNMKKNSTTENTENNSEI